MKVQITSYTVYPVEQRVSVDLSVDVDTKTVSVSVSIPEHTLYGLAGEGNTWAEPHIVAVVSKYFRGLADVVTV